MPIYEFYCPQCHMIFNFFSRTINTEKIPSCPTCDRPKLERQMSSFAVLRGLKEDQENGLPDIDESKLEKAMTALAGEAERINEDDPKQAAQLMRKLTQMTGLELGSGMEEALRRMEAGEDPEQIEAEMGDLLEEEDPLVFQGQKKTGSRKPPPRKDDKLYEL
ncbi:MAG: zinc ribbon domain-containing protein [Proteobacteria bacterium]|jgi:putative FmdB family regulatory protein|nr:zinc ribbon domain-containing protein [Pseudomonadota bacterium]MBW2625620.1 zinc ribbon domain-containing protein [Deltaproteobacteria bacterium]MCK5657789.1 zinc ribbon domain-containing protein [Deltaproteobacteria bacterium]RLA88630.1 MAG: zinc ribbon domain-containing protein [Deltaproteobacteria bacterium]